MLPNLSNRNTIEISADIADNILKNKDNAKAFFLVSAGDFIVKVQVDLISKSRVEYRAAHMSCTSSYKGLAIGGIGSTHLTKLSASTFK